MDHNELLNNNHINKKVKICSVLSLLFCLILGLTIVILVVIFRDNALNLIFSYEKKIKEHFILALLIFFLSTIIGGIFILPSALFEIVNGFIFATLFNGEFIGLIIAIPIFLTFSSLSCLVTYAFSKLMFGKKLKQILVETNNNMKILNLIFIKEGFRAMFLIRLSPLLPSSIFNYLAAGFDISYFDFFFSAYGSFPLTTFYVYIGYSTISLDSLEKNMIKNSKILKINLEIVSIVLIIFGVFVLLFAMIYFGRYAEYNFKKLMEENKTTDEFSNGSSSINIIEEENFNQLRVPLNE